MRNICVFIGSRANYSSIKSAMLSINKHPDLHLQVVVGASALLDRYGSVVNLIEEDGFSIEAKLYMLIEGETPATMAKSTGVGLIELPAVFERLQPDIVLTVGDRFETMATTLASAYMNIPVAHTMGGEVTGTIDESIRHAVTKFAHIHFPASMEAAERIIKLGEREEDVYMVGCPRIDLVAEILEADQQNDMDQIFLQGAGEGINLHEPFVLLSQHPVTTEYGEGENQITQTLMAIKRTGLPAIVLWPNADAGSEDVARGIRKWREMGLGENMHFFKNLPITTYIRLMKQTVCLIGNSSSGIREGAYIGTPVINIGTRQEKRERGNNVLDVSYSAKEIYEAIQFQISNGSYQSEAIYGDGSAGDKIAHILSKCNWKIQKRITY
jgi:UDP-hydrolysing UDP-N-acetyl-D-glucosamine 2-epimerase